MKYKVGDKVRIKSLDWFNTNKTYGDTIELESGYNFTSAMSKFCDSELTIEYIHEDGNLHHYVMEEVIYAWTDEMIEGLMEKEIVPKFKVGDIIGRENNLTNSYLVTSVTSEFYGLRIKNGVGVLPVKGQDEWVLLSVVEDDNVLEDLIKKPVEINIPDGYEFRDENGNVINARKIVLEKKKKEYPKTYEECCKILGCKANHFFTNFSYNGLDIEISDYEDKIDDLLQNFRKLRYCRDAYWKIAGDEMGLGKPWEPDWREKRHIIYRNQDDIIGGYREAGYVEHHIFEFPTKEMRDAFYENFKKEIEMCKELL